MAVSANDCAHQVLEVVPAIMRTIRGEMRDHRTSDLSVPQFRTLAFINRHTGASLSDAANHIGLTLPSMSKMVDGLVARKLIARETHQGDRRRMTLALTARGQAALRSAHEATRDCLAELLSQLSSADRATVAAAMQLLRPIFVQPSEAK